MALHILFEDERLLALDKPAGRLVVAGRGESEPPLIEEASAQAGRKLFVVHRLDRETSGVLLLAKDAAAHRALNLLFEGREVDKRYRAVVRGRLERARVIDEPLAEFGSGRVGVRKEGKPSRTELRPIEWLGPATLIEALPKTGRRHQVRVHCYAAGHPVLGDPLYGPGADTPPRPPRLMLHAAALAFTLDGRRIEVAADTPADFSGFLEALRRGSPPLG